MSPGEFYHGKSATFTLIFLPSHTVLRLTVQLETCIEGVITSICVCGVDVGQIRECFIRGGFLTSGFGLFVAGEQLFHTLFDTVYVCKFEKKNYFYFVRIQQGSNDVLRVGQDHSLK